MATIPDGAVMQAVMQDDNTGYCTECGEEHCVEPDARAYECEYCGERKVYGAPELLMMGYM